MHSKLRHGDTLHNHLLCRTVGQQLNLMQVQVAEDLAYLIDWSAQESSFSPLQALQHVLNTMEYVLVHNISRLFILLGAAFFQQLNCRFIDTRVVTKLITNSPHERLMATLPAYFRAVLSVASVQDKNAIATAVPTSKSIPVLWESRPLTAGQLSEAFNDTSRMFVTIPALFAAMHEGRKLDETKALDLTRNGIACGPQHHSGSGSYYCTADVTHRQGRSSGTIQQILGSTNHDPAPIIHNTRERDHDCPPIQSIREALIDGIPKAAPGIGGRNPSARDAGHMITHWRQASLGERWSLHRVVLALSEICWQSPCGVMDIKLCGTAGQEQLVFAQVQVSKCFAYLLDWTVINSKFTHRDALRTMLNTMKHVLVHDILRVGRILGAGMFEGLTCRFIDIQVVAERLCINPTPTLMDYLQCMLGSAMFNSWKKDKARATPCNSAEWFQRPLPGHLVDEALLNTTITHVTISILFSAFQGNSRFGSDLSGSCKMIMESTEQRLQAILSPVRAVKQPPEPLPPSLPTVHTTAYCDIDPLIALLPEPMLLALQDPETYVAVRQQCFEIQFDYGSRPFWTTLEAASASGSSAAFWLCDDPALLVSKQHLLQITQSLTFGPSNRACLAGHHHLHRISCTKSAAGEVVGVTMRVGRVVMGRSNLIRDLLYPSHPQPAVGHDDQLQQPRNILILGGACSGKTSLLREIAGLLAEQQQSKVCIIDTCNEICGAGDIPHPCVGNATRIMVQQQQQKQQHEVMLECLATHYPAVLVIDEISKLEEVQTAAVIKQQGVWMIAGVAAGSFHFLLGNAQLNGLLGGVKPVFDDIDGCPVDFEDSLSLERIGQPIFDALIELDNGRFNECAVIEDAGQAVDNALQHWFSGGEKRSFAILELQLKRQLAGVIR